MVKIWYERGPLPVRQVAIGLIILPFLFGGCSSPEVSSSAEQGLASSTDAWENEGFVCPVPMPASLSSARVYRKPLSQGGMTYSCRGEEIKLKRSFGQRSKWTTSPLGFSYLPENCALTIQFEGSTTNRRAKVWIDGKLHEKRIECTGAD